MSRIALMLAQLTAAMNSFYAINSRRVFALTIAGQHIELFDGEEYAGPILHTNGTVIHHVVLLAGDCRPMAWRHAPWAASKLGGSLPTRREQSLLAANLDHRFEQARYWSAEQHVYTDSQAWYQDFTYGTQGACDKQAKCRVIAIRRVLPEGVKPASTSQAGA